MTPSFAVKALGRPIHARFPVRWSTAIMVVAFLGLGNLYLDVRAPTLRTVQDSVATSTTTRPPETILPSESTSTSGAPGGATPGATDAPSSTVATQVPDSSPSTSTTSASATTTSRIGGSTTSTTVP
jgi:hypothetical protein